MGFKLVFMSIFISFSLVSIAQQPLLRYKPDPLRADSFDILLGFSPLKLFQSKINLATEMRLTKNYTFRFESSLKDKERNPFFTNIQNLEVTDPSRVIFFNEQSGNFMIKRYKKNRSSKVFFGPYLGLGLNLSRTNIKMTSQIFGFDDVEFDFRTTRKSLVIAIGTSKVFGKNVIFDYSIKLNYLYNSSKIGNFEISGPSYKSGWKGSFAFGVFFPIVRR